MQRKICTRKLDELGRIVLPWEARAALGIKRRQSIDIYLEDNTVIIKKNEESPCCALCGAAEALSEVEDNFLCEACIHAIKEL